MDFGGLKVLMISSDRNIAVPGSAVAERMKECGAMVEELHIVLLSDKSHGLKNTELSKNVWVYPTNSAFKYRRPYSAARIGKKIVFDKKFVRGSSVITTQDPFECGLAGLKIKNKWRLPLEVQLHTDPFSPYFTGFLNHLRKRIAKKVFKKADSLRVVSKAVAERVAGKIDLSQEKVSILPIYVDKDKLERPLIIFDLHARYGWHFILLAVSRLAPEKNIAQILKALAYVTQSFPDTGLVVVGSGPEEGNLKRLSKTLGIERNVVFAGWQDDLGSFYRTANLFVQTSFFEGYGMSLVEAGLAGLPIITTPVGIAEEFEDGKEAYLCLPGDPEYLANVIVDLIENNQNRENLRINIKHALESRLLSKQEYLERLKSNWLHVSKLINL